MLWRKIADLDEKCAHFCFHLLDNRPGYRHALKIFEYLFHGVPWFMFAIAGYLFGTGYYSNLSFILLKGLIIDIVFIGLTKAMFRRTRPRYNRQHEMAMGTNTGADKYSFPSGHSSRAIFVSCLLTLFLATMNRSIYFKLIGGFILNLISYITCISRLLLVRHYLSDVIVGIIYGYLFVVLTILI